MKKIKFIKYPHSYNEVDSFVVHISIVHSEKELMNELNSKFKFPYFGYNWDALYDLLRDFHWIDQKKIVMVHDQMPDFDHASMKIYILLLRDSINDWKLGEDHILEVIFPEEGKSLIRAILHSDL